MAKKKTTKTRAPRRVTKFEAKLRAFFAPMTGYFIGAWQELRQVRWPNRASTWSLTLAVIVFSLFFVVLVTLLDILFEALFELLIA